jgi:subtilisin family serine protease
VEIDSFEPLIALRRRPDVRYVEPLGYLTEAELQKSEAGCSNDPEPFIPAEDFGTVTPAATVPWNFFETNIPDAWPLSTGRGVTVALIDTGVSAAQAKLGGEFATGDSTGRFIEKAGTFRPDSDGPPDGPDDDCGHGTLMAGTIAAPRSSGGAIAGVAHGANLLAIRATDDVVLNSANEKKGVADALVLAANRDDVKVISMSLGHIFSSSRIEDAVRYAHARGKLMFVAAGTSTSFTSWVGVTFPATMDEVVAVTGVETGAGLVRCDVCHAGSAVDFVVVMQRAEDSDRTSLSLAMSGDTPGRVGGSSTATATMAGVAALVWARNPLLTRDQVLQILREASSLYPDRDDDFGFGTVDAGLAVSLVP